MLYIYIYIYMCHVYYTCPTPSCVYPYAAVIWLAALSNYHICTDRRPCVAQPVFSVWVNAMQVCIAPTTNEPVICPIVLRNELNRTRRKQG